MAKFKEKYSEAIVCDQLGTFINGDAAHRNLCDMAVQITKSKVYVPEDVPFPDTVTTETAEDTGVKTVTVGFDLAPEADKVKLTYPEAVLEVSDPTVAGNDVTFTITPKAVASVDTYSTVVVNYEGYCRIIPVDCLINPEPVVEPEPDPSQVTIDSITASPESAAVGTDILITIKFSGTPSEGVSLEVSAGLTVTSALAMTDATGVATVQGTVAGEQEVTVKYGNGMQVAKVTITD